MARPTRFCAKCGEYVADGVRYVNVGGTLTPKNVLIHIDADGREIYRAHAPVEEGSNSRLR
jgi:hypothetical protein